MTEDQLQRQIVDWLTLSKPDGLFFTACNPVPSKTKAVAGRSKNLGMRAGVPDLLLCYQGRFVGVELKQPRKYPTPVQRECHAEIQQAGGVVTVCRSLSEFVDFLDVLGVQHRTRVSA